MNIKKATIVLDLVLLIMSVMWTSYSILRGITWLELGYIYTYFIIALIASILNLKLLLKK